MYTFDMLREWLPWLIALIIILVMAYLLLLLHFKLRNREEGISVDLRR